MSEKVVRSTDCVECNGDGFVAFVEDGEQVQSYREGRPHERYAYHSKRLQLHSNSDVIKKIRADIHCGGDRTNSEAAGMAALALEVIDAAVTAIESLYVDVEVRVQRCGRCGGTGRNEVELIEKLK